MRLTRFAALLSVCLLARTVTAHPLGNDSITHFNVLHVMPDALEIDYLLDIAENPSQIIEQNEMDTNKDGQIDRDEQDAWLTAKALQFASELDARLDGAALPVVGLPQEIDPLTSQPAAVTRVIVPMLGPMGMTYRVVIRYRAAFASTVTPGEHTILFEDKTYAQHQGLKLILLQPESDQSAESGDEDTQAHCEILPPHPPFVSDDNAVFRYEQYDPMNLPDVRKASFRFKLQHAPPPPATQDSAPAAEHSPLPSHANDFLDPNYNPLQKDKFQRQAESMIGMLQGRWGFTLLLVITATAFGWGAAHALMPGHAKTVVAAYLISEHGTYWHAMVLAIIVTVTHTALVVILGLVLWIYQLSHPRLAPTLQDWLGLLAGILVAGMGLTLAWRALTGRIAGHHHDHSHEHHHHHDERSWLRKLFTHSHPHVPDHNHGHDHAHNHTHSHAHHHEHTHAPSQLSMRTLLILGVSGGIVPCPTTTIIMFLGIGANVIGGALYTIAVFSLGLALTLMAVGSLALSSRRYAARLLSDARHETDLSGGGKRLLLQYVPAISGAVVTLIGAAIAINYLCLIKGVASPFPWLDR